MPTIQHLTALEILDSRGRPTVQATCHLTSGAEGTASVPSGASTGAAEALELRDNDPMRFGGKGCLQAVAAINGEIMESVRSVAFTQTELDQHLTRLDGTPNKARLGANAILAVSLAFARACAAEQKQPLYSYFSGLLQQSIMPAMPRPIINLFSGGKHAGGQVAVQDVLVCPVRAKTMAELLSITTDVYQAAANLIQERYGMRLLRADEGGLAPNFQRVEEMLDLAVEAVERAGYRFGDEVALAVDAAATHFYEEDSYLLDDERLTADGLIARYQAWQARYGLIGLEDGLSENDWANWANLREQLGGGMMIIGDDLLCTNPTRIEQAVERGAANALLLKVNQIGTLTEAAEAYQRARAAGWRVIVSARSGETEDNWLADLAVGWRADHIKVGSVTQSDRLAKYNRLLAIEAETGWTFASS